MTIVEMYVSDYCPYCTSAKRLLDSKNIDYKVIDVNISPEIKQEMIERSGQRTVPQIFINNKSIGGCDDLYALNDAEKLDKLLI